ncbi:SDR family NAD(P)-dependent oxidoreductase [Streptomyces sp. NPDC005435]|uniref:SDR family NAD(P)-dependent oxidoreductase n=1 Tax=Streptomyces sp. NPDC005435 TaxID=3154464 RepID=UPI0034528F80
MPHARVQETADAYGRLGILVNNAGLMLLGPGVGADAWDRMIAVNVQGLLYTTDAALPHLLAAADTAPRRVADVSTPSTTWRPSPPRTWPTASPTWSPARATWP